MIPPNSNLTSETFWQGAFFAALVDAVLFLFLLWRIKPRRFRELKWVLVATAAIFWGIFATALLWGFWDSYYRHFYPDSTRWLGAIAAMLYGAIAFVLRWLSLRVPGNPIAAFCLLGGVEGLLEHLWGIYGLGVLERVPMLQRASAPSVLAFSFFEYVFYWGIVLGIATLLQWIRQWTKMHQQANAPTDRLSNEKVQ